MLAATGADDRSIRLWGLSPLVHQSSQRTQIAVLHGHGGPVTCLEVMKGEGGASRLLSGSTDGKVKLWDLASASCAWTLKCSMPIERLKITTGTEQEYLLAAGNSIWKLLDVRNARAAHALSIEQSGGRDLHCRKLHSLLICCRWRGFSQQSSNMSTSIAALEVEKRTALEQEETERARSVGLHIRGKAVFREGMIDEDDQARFFWHRQVYHAEH